FFSAQNMAALQKIVMGVGKAFAFASKNALRLAKAITIDPLIKGFKKLTNGVRSFGRRLKFVVLQGLLFRNMRKYLSEFAQSLGAAMKKNDQFSASLANLKGTFWASIAPVVDALAPILARFLDMIAKLITYLSGLVGILFKIGKASKTAGAGLASAGESAKDAGNNLASWDTIQNLDTGGGGDSGSGISPTFGQDFDEAYERLEKLRELLEAGDWFEIGKYVGEKLSEVITVINNWITGTLYPWVQKWATNLGQFINGFFVGMDWSTLGATVGNAIITVFDGISTFLETVDWHKVGESVKEFLLGINWSEVLKSVGTAIGNALIAAIDFTEGLTGLDLSGLEKAFKNLLDYINNLIDLITGKKSFEEWFNDLSDGEAIITAIVVALGSLAAIIGVIIGLFMLWKAVKGIISALTSPIGLVILAIAAVIAIVVLLIKHWDEVKAKLKEVWNALVQVWEDIKTMFKAVINVVLDVLKYIWGLWKEFTDRVDLVFEALWEDIKTIFNAVVNFVVGGVKKLIEWVKKFWSDVKTTWKLTVDSTKQFIDQIKGYIEAFKAKVVSIIDNIKTKATTVINAIRDGIKGAINFIIRFINGLISRVESAINTIISGINRLGFTIPDWIPVIGGKHLGLSLNSIYLGRVPELAQGTVVNPGHQFAAILGDNRHEQEIVSPLSTMKQALIEALQESGNSGSGQLVINLDGKQIANAVIPRINNRTRMYGTSVIL
ncbi:MAG: hypothetical protein J5725_08735, partial [Bacteroidales bacterium]|nr:hypothetical protein [Bacteroidales bacterium]